MSTVKSKKANLKRTKKNSGIKNISDILDAIVSLVKDFVPSFYKFAERIDKARKKK